MNINDISKILVCEINIFLAIIKLGVVYEW